MIAGILVHLLLCQDNIHLRSLLRQKTQKKKNSSQPATPNQAIRQILVSARLPKAPKTNEHGWHQKLNCGSTD